MSRRGAGIGLILVAALLYAMRYITAALFTPPNLGTYGEETFSRWLGYIGDGPVRFSVIASLVGVAYLALAEWDDLRQHRARGDTRHAGRQPAEGEGRQR